MSDTAMKDQQSSTPGGPLLTGRREGFSLVEVVVTMVILAVIVIVLILMLFGALPNWPHSQGWGYYPAGGLGLVLLVLIILLLLGRL